MSKAKPTTEAPPKPTTGESIRETIDSIVIAFVLAFLFRTFEAEAFVIPTGSMALTLMGDHKDLACSQCGYHYRASASSESPTNSAHDQRMFSTDPARWQEDHTVTSSVCPNCRYRMHYGDGRAGAVTPTPPSYKGDRILVTKYSYEFSDPQRWDVAVFKNPSQAKINYIKRIAGLPNEEVLIYRGDVYVRHKEDEPFRMARKAHDKALAMAQTVYDNDFVLAKLHERGWPQRWASETSDGEPAWKQSADLKSFRTEGRGQGEEWLRYRHYVPSSFDWNVLETQPLAPDQRTRAKPQLITDFCEYNAERIRNGSLNRDVSYLGMHWVGDIGVECEVTITDPRGSAAEVVLEIVEGGRAYQCRIGATSGDVRLSISGLDAYHPAAPDTIRGTGPHRVRFANVDDQLLVWVDGIPVEFDASTKFQTVEKLKAAYEDRNVEVRFAAEGTLAALNNLQPTRQDVGSPIGIAAVGCAVDVAHLRVFRDVYYIADSANSGNQSTGLGFVRDYRVDVMKQFADERAKRGLQPLGDLWGERNLVEFMSDVDTLPQRFTEASFVSFKMDEDQYFVLGDNSPRSLDGRLWDPEETYVRRELLIGKALFVYWPHALDRIPGTGIPFPYFPNFTQMRMIR